MTEAKKTDKLVAPLVASHYRKMGIIPGWSSERFMKLCALANRTPEELGAFAALEPRETRRFLERGMFSPVASLHFAVIDAVLREARFGEPYVPIVPLDMIDL